MLAQERHFPGHAPDVTGAVGLAAKCFPMGACGSADSCSTDR